jgi:hypothetical protein
MNWEDYVIYNMKVRAIMFVVTIFGVILYFGSYSIGTNLYETFMRWFNHHIISLSLSVSITAWLIVGFCWGCYALYRDGK